MSDLEHYNPEENQWLATESVNRLRNVNATPYVSGNLCNQQHGESPCALDNSCDAKDSQENYTDQILKEGKMALLREDSCSVDKDKTFTIHINGLPTLVSSAEPFVNPQRLFPQPGLLFLDVTSQILVKKVSESQRQEYTKLLTDNEAERERLRKKLKIYRFRMSQSARTTGKRRKGEHDGTTMEDAESTERCAVDKGETTTFSTPLSELSIADKMLATATSGSSNLKGYDADKNSIASEEIATAVNEIALLTQQIAGLRKKIENLSSLSPPPVLLLPSPSNGCVRVYANHYYHTVKFIGEHLCLTGRLESFFVAPHSSKTDSLSHQPCEDLNGVSEEDLINRNEKGSKDASSNLKAQKTNSNHQESENEWIELEMVGIRNYLKNHPGAVAEEFFKLPTEERAAYTTRTL